MIQQRSIPMTMAFWTLAPLLALGLLLAGCGKSQRLMPRPNLYAKGPSPFANVPEALRSDDLPILFATDRFPEQRSANDPLTYGARRSSHLQIGTCIVHVDGVDSWEELEKVSMASRPGRGAKLWVGEPDVLLRYPGNYWHSARIDDPSDNYDHYMQRRAEARARFHTILDTRLAHTPRKEAFVYIHGYNSHFHHSVATMANLWHFMGREGVGIAYTWPAGAGGLVGYTTDSESGEFTIYHLKMFLEDLAAHPEIEKINILAHSRGTDVAMTAIRELVIARRAAGLDPLVELKLGHVILASPDIDFEVASQRIASEHILNSLDHLTIYLSRKDRALMLSRWLHKSWSRLGLINVERLTDGQIQTITHLGNVDFIDSELESDFFGHGYFYNNPSASSDVILNLRDKRLAGEATGRPLKLLAPKLWLLEEGYPQ